MLTSSTLKRNGGGDHVDHEQRHERKHDGLVDRVTHAGGPATDRNALVAGDQARGQPEQGGLDQGDEDVGQTRSAASARRRTRPGSRAGRTPRRRNHPPSRPVITTDDNISCDERRRQHPRHHQRLDRVDAHAPAARRAPRGWCARPGRRTSRWRRRRRPPAPSRSGRSAPPRGRAGSGEVGGAELDQQDVEREHGEHRERDRQHQRGKH